MCTETVLASLGPPCILTAVILCLGVCEPPHHVRRIQTNYRLLSETMDVDYGLLDELLSKDVISHREMLTVKAGKTFYHRNEELLNILMQKREDKFRQFIVALKAFDMTELAGSLE